MVNKEDVDAMKKILMSLSSDNTEVYDADKPVDKQHLNENSNIKPDVLEMKKILSSFQDVANKTVGNIVSTSKNDPIIKETLRRRITENSMQYGHYKVISKYTKTKIKVYDVLDMNTNECIANDLFLYESAFAITKLLNKGNKPLDHKIRKIIMLEEKYCSNRAEAIYYKKKKNSMLTEGKTKEYNIMSAKYNNAQNVASSIQQELKVIVGQL